MQPISPVSTAAPRFGAKVPFIEARDAQGKKVLMIDDEALDTFEPMMKKSRHTKRDVPKAIQQRNNELQAANPDPRIARKAALKEELLSSLQATQSQGE